MRTYELRELSAELRTMRNRKKMKYTRNDIEMALLNDPDPIVVAKFDSEEDAHKALANTEITVNYMSGPVSYLLIKGNCLASYELDEYGEESDLCEDFCENIRFDSDAKEFYEDSNK